MIKDSHIHIEIVTNGNEHTAAVLRSRAEVREAVEASYDILNLSRQLLNEVDAALARTGVHIQQPALPPIPLSETRMASVVDISPPSPAIRGYEGCPPWRAPVPKWH
jgi:hypothetical protein